MQVHMQGASGAFRPMVAEWAVHGGQQDVRVLAMQESCTGGGCMQMLASSFAGAVGAGGQLLAAPAPFGALARSAACVRVHLLSIPTALSVRSPEVLAPSGTPHARARAAPTHPHTRFGWLLRRGPLFTGWTAAGRTHALAPSSVSAQQHTPGLGVAALTYLG